MYMSTGYVFFKGRYVHFVGLQHMRCGTSDMESTSFILFSDQTPKMCLQPTPTACLCVCMSGSAPVQLP